MPDKTGRKTGQLVPQEHGGAILDGAAHPERHVPGPGRPPSRVKADLRGDFDERRAILKEIADDKKASARDRLKAIDVMAKYSDLGDTSLPTEDVLRILTDLMSAREGWPTVVTSNMTPDALAKRWQSEGWARLSSRLGPQNFRAVRVKGADRRFAA